MKRRLILIAIIIVGLIIAYFIYTFRQTRKQSQADSAAVIKQIRTLSRLETSSFTIEKIIDEGVRENALKDVLFGDRILLIAHGEVIAGFDFTNLSDDSLVVDGKTVTLALGKPQILVTRLDNGKTRVYDRRKGLLAPENKDLEAQARAEAETSIRTAACEADILGQASENAKKQLTTLLQSMGYVSITITTEPSDCS